MIEFTQIFANLTTEDLDVIFHYQWRQEERYQLVKNPFVDVQMHDEGDPQHQFLVHLAVECQQALGIDLTLRSFSMDDGDYKKLKKIIEAAATTPDG